MDEVVSARPSSTNDFDGTYKLLGELDEIESKVAQIQVLLSYTDELYALKSHIQFVRRLDCPVVVMMKGQVLRRGTYAEISADPAVRRQALLQQVAKIGP